MNTTLPKITTRKQFCDFLQEIIWELENHSSTWYYIDLLTYLNELLIHMSFHALEQNSDESIPFKELAIILDRARRGGEDDGD